MMSPTVSWRILSGGHGGAHAHEALAVLLDEAVGALLVGAEYGAGDHGASLRPGDRVPVSLSPRVTGHEGSIGRIEVPANPARHGIPTSPRRRSVGTASRYRFSVASKSAKSLIENN